MRILPLADIHNALDVFKWVETELLNQFDVLTISGDMCEGKDVAKHTKFKDYLVDFQQRINTPIVMTQGNHDYWSLSLFDDVPDIHLLHNDTLRLQGKTFYGSPMSKPFLGWNWNVEEADMYDIWMDTVPRRVDVGLFHTPPFGVCDNVLQACHGNNAETHLGSVSLQVLLYQKEIDYIFCGHIHTSERYGVSNTTKIYNVSCLDEKYQFQGFNPNPSVVVI